MFEEFGAPKLQQVQLPKGAIAMCTAASCQVQTWIWGIIWWLQSQPRSTSGRAECVSTSCWRHGRWKWWSWNFNSFPSPKEKIKHGQPFSSWHGIGKRVFSCYRFHHGTVIPEAAHVENPYRSFKDLRKSFIIWYIFGASPHSPPCFPPGAWRCPTPSTSCQFLVNKS